MLKRLLMVVALFIAACPPAAAQESPMAAPTVHVESAELSPIGQTFDAHKATDAYLATVSPKDRARSDAYFEGGYVLLVVDIVYTLVIAGLLLFTKASAWMRNNAVKVTRYRRLQVTIYVLQYLTLVTILSLPLSIYEDFLREHLYGLSSQPFLGWALDFGKAFLLKLIGFVILLNVLYAVMRAVQRRWWAWATVVTVAFMILFATVYPVFIAPVFNHYAPLPDSGMRNTILSLARSQGIPATDVYAFDASKQTNKISANVSGLFGTARISLNDNLLNRCTPSEIIAVLGHEMGHYVMNHVAVSILWFGLILLAGFWFVDRTFHGLIGIFGGNWDVRSIDDPAGLPLLMAMFFFFMFLAKPLTNTITRTQEIQADIFGLDAVRQPDAFATVVLKLAEYRKLDPSPLEETVFFDHPSGRTRIYEAMRWKEEHLHDPDIVAGPTSPQ